MPLGAQTPVQSPQEHIVKGSRVHLSPAASVKLHQQQTWCLVPVPTAPHTGTLHTLHTKHVYTQRRHVQTRTPARWDTRHTHNTHTHWLVHSCSHRRTHWPGPTHWPFETSLREVQDGSSRTDGVNPRKTPSPLPLHQLAWHPTPVWAGVCRYASPSSLWMEGSVWHRSARDCVYPGHRPLGPPGQDSSFQPSSRVCFWVFRPQESLPGVERPQRVCGPRGAGLVSWLVYSGRPGTCWCLRFPAVPGTNTGEREEEGGTTVQRGGHWPHSPCIYLGSSPSPHRLSTIK